jgi:hypothetical protein
MDEVLKHLADSFEPGLGQLVDQGFEFLTSGHGGPAFRAR